MLPAHPNDLATGGQLCDKRRVSSQLGDNRIGCVYTPPDHGGRCKLVSRSLAETMTLEFGFDRRSAMASTADLVLQVQPGPEGDDEELAALTVRLRVELLDLDVQAVDPLINDTAPEGAKGLVTLAGWLAIYLGEEELRTVLAKVADWASCNDRVVELRSGSDVLELGKATREQQASIIDAWLAGHTN
jgi:hypothetical protein